MKWVLIVLLIFAIMLIANALSQQYKDKCEFYNNLKNFLNQFKINVSFKKEKIPNFISNTYCKKQFKVFLDAYKDFLNTGNLDLTNLKILEENEKLELSDIVQNLGKYNSENEDKQLNGYLVIIEEKLLRAQEEKSRLCPMIIKLSLLFGIGLAIILI